MARKISSRTVVNRKALTAIRAGFVDGMEAIGQAVLAGGAGKVPDDPATSQRIDGDYGIWVDGKKVAGGASKPRAVRVKSGITLICGYEFPGRFQALGTVHIPPNPSWFVNPMNDALPGAAGYIKPKVRAQLARVR